MAEKTPTPKEVNKLIASYEGLVKDQKSQTIPILKELGERRVARYREEIIAQLGVSDTVAVVRRYQSHGIEITGTDRDKLLDEAFGLALEQYPGTRQILNDLVFGEPQPPVRRATETITPSPTEHRAEKSTRGPQIRQLTTHVQPAKTELPASPTAPEIRFVDSSQTIISGGKLYPISIKHQYELLKEIYLAGKPINSTDLTPVLRRLNLSPTTRVATVVGQTNKTLERAGAPLRIERTEGTKKWAKYGTRFTDQPQAEKPVGQRKKESEQSKMVVLIGSQPIDNERMLVEINGEKFAISKPALIIFNYLAINQEDTAESVGRQLKANGFNIYPSNAYNIISLDRDNQLKLYDTFKLTGLETRPKRWKINPDLYVKWRIAVNRENNKIKIAGREVGLFPYELTCLDAILSSPSQSSEWIDLFKQIYGEKAFPDQKRFVSTISQLLSKVPELTVAVQQLDNNYRTIKIDCSRFELADQPIGPKPLQIRSLRPAAPAAKARAEAPIPKPVPEQPSKPKSEKEALLSLLPTTEEAAVLMSFISNEAYSERRTHSGIAMPPEKWYDELFKQIPQRKAPTGEELIALRDAAIDKMLAIYVNPLFKEIQDFIKSDPRVHLFDFFKNNEASFEALKSFSGTEIKQDQSIRLGTGYNVAVEVKTWFETGNGDKIDDSKPQGSRFEKLNSADLVKPNGDQEKFRTQFPDVALFIDKTIEFLSQTASLNEDSFHLRQVSVPFSIKLHELQGYVDKYLRKNQRGDEGRAMGLTMAEAIECVCYLKNSGLKKKIGENKSKEILRKIISQKLKTARAAQKKPVKK